ncbi:2TM domain-containing protein [Maribacter confluentis]|uniref:2TM domain-containing protein n=2 Tax=Maribacter TaxID=252356 RepID=A0ABY1SFK3_9FLAO|nr:MULTISPECIES: 2TM domain-containing protein [Maribacter]MDO1511427.1 2TM domain-containing protein [Maribacter confluentis]SNR42249.1 2TM domain-containing protein [Maribacter sedimenticola]
MEINEFEQNEKLARAKKQVKELKGFYIHLFVYILVNLFIMSLTVMARMNSGESFNEAFFNFGTFSTPFFWGIGLAFHGARVYHFNPFFSKDWEERQIRKFVEQEQKEADKFR